MAGGDSARRERERDRRAEAGGRKVWPLRRGGEDAFKVRERERWSRQRGLTPRVLRLASGPHPGIQRGKGEQVSSHWRRPAVIAGAGFTASCSRSRFSTPLPGCWLLSGVRWNKQTAAT